MENRTTGKDTSPYAASSYDAQREKLAALKDCLHLCTQMILSDLPPDARLLCVGAGTGAELIYLAQSFPHWRFTVVEPASDMMKTCRQKALDHGIDSRCEFHEGYLDTLSETGAETEKFHAATSILVSHYLGEENKRVEYFSRIAAMVEPGGYMINADLSGDVQGGGFEDMMAVWINMHAYAHMPINADSFRKNFLLYTEEKLESVLKTAGFQKPVLFFQTFFIHAWFSRTAMPA